MKIQDIEKELSLSDPLYAEDLKRKKEFFEGAPARRKKLMIVGLALALLMLLISVGLSRWGLSLSAQKEIGESVKHLCFVLLTLMHQFIYRYGVSKVKIMLMRFHPQVSKWGPYVIGVIIMALTAQWVYAINKRLLEYMDIQYTWHGISWGFWGMTLELYGLIMVNVYLGYFFWLRGRFLNTEQYQMMREKRRPSPSKEQKKRPKS